MFKRAYLLFLFVLFFNFSPLQAMKPEDVPNPRSTANIDVQDSAQVLNPEYIHLINKICDALEKSTQAQMAVVTVDNLDGLTVEDYSMQVATRFGIGKKGKDDGILILFARDDRKVRIEVGYGLEGVLTDAKTKSFIQNLAIPRFKEKEYGRGLYELAKALAETVAQSENVKLGIEDSQNLPTQAATPRATESTEKETSLSETKTTEVQSSLFSKNPIQVFLLISLAFTLFWLLLTTFKLKNKTGHVAKIDFLQEYYEYSFGSVWVFGFFGAAIYAFILDDVWTMVKAFVLAAAGSWFLAFIYKKFTETIIRKSNLACKKCQMAMTLLPENESLKKLSEKEKVEQSTGAMAYEFWICSSCHSTEKIENELSSASSKKCPKCNWFSLSTSSRDTGKDTYLIIDDCLNPKCAYRKESSHTRSSSSSKTSSWGFGSSRSGGGSSSRSYGGGSFGGGGSSGSW